jgi:hypothetical protein
MATNPSEAEVRAHAFSAEDALIIRRIAGAIIGPSAEHSLPGANDEAIAARILRDGAKHERAIHAAIRDFAGDATARVGLQAFNEAEFSGKLRSFLNIRPAFGSLMIWLVAEAYYQDERVLRSIGMEARPPFPKGHVVEPSDWSLLEPVKRMGRIFRDPPPRRDS